MKISLAAFLALSLLPSLSFADSAKLDAYCRVTAVHDGLFEESLGVHGEEGVDEDSTYVSIEIDQADISKNYVKVGGASYSAESGDNVSGKPNKKGAWTISASNGDSASSGHLTELRVKLAGDQGTVGYRENKKGKFQALADFDCSKQ
jgi:hypothetical protein